MHGPDYQRWNWPANRSKYSMVNQVMQTASTIASFGLSAGFPASSRIPTDGIVLTVMPAVDTTTKVIEIILTIWNINKTGRHSSMVNTAACYQWGPGFESPRGGELLILNKTELLIWICSQWVCVCFALIEWSLLFPLGEKGCLCIPIKKILDVKPLVPLLQELCQ